MVINVLSIIIIGSSLCLLSRLDADKDGLGYLLPLLSLILEAVVIYWIYWCNLALVESIIILGFLLVKVPLLLAFRCTK